MAHNFQMFSTDLDGTLLGNPESTQRFTLAWMSMYKEFRPKLVYNSGRMQSDVLALIKSRRIPEPEYIISGVGTGIYDFQAKREFVDFAEQFKLGWDLKKIEAILNAFPGVERQPEEFLHPYKSSWFLPRADNATIELIEKQLAESGLNAVVVYSSLRYLDVLPARANKGNALAWLCARLGIASDRVLVAGDTGNDSSMFLLPGVQGIIVENAQPELFEAVVRLPVFCSQQIMADGVLEGLKHFGLVPTNREPAPEAAGTPVVRDFKMPFSKDLLRGLSEQDREFIATGYEKALVALRKNLTPLGFSACSLADNTVVGTDANYRSVWARDGAITLIQTQYLNDPDIRAAQRNTLRTLLDAISPTGQIPANVRIDDHVPDYSGVGGICSIDSGLWVVMAFYHYVNVTQDYGLLHEYSHRLQRVMDWLSAHDSNNDGLLEVPEAGDWTDLFGRSYHVLYDEILWYRANVCYGRLLEFQHDYARSADYLRWSQQILGKIRSVFWPTTKGLAGADAINTFAHRQYSLGDVQYMLAEITPFSFNWRCDVYANILAYLCNVIDADHARTAFRFMWGAGVSDPWPVVNLYPTVQAGDPDWKPYYTVNMLNLPNSYHNGGIWPFIGGLWVRFIHRLGLHDIACQELLKLARINKLGQRFEWEFNEWAHGKTGRPMGKAYQAWSAASYIRACQELQVGNDGTQPLE